MDEQLIKLKARIPFDEDKYKSEEIYEKDLSMLLEDAKNIALDTIYPFSDDFDELKLPSKYYNWQIRAAVELNKWAGNHGIKSYSEGGLSWTKATDGVIPLDMLEELTPKAGVPRRKEIDNQ